MDNLELTWETYEFHTNCIAELEEEHIDNLKNVETLLNKTTPVTNIQKLKLRKKAVACCNKLISAYKKHLDCIDELIKIHSSECDIPTEREADIQLFNELKNVSATLMEEMNIYREKLSDILG